MNDENSQFAPGGSGHSGGPGRTGCAPLGSSAARAPVPVAPASAASPSSVPSPVELPPKIETSWVDDPSSPYSVPDPAQPGSAEKRPPAPVQKAPTGRRSAWRFLFRAPSTPEELEELEHSWLGLALGGGPSKSRGANAFLRIIAIILAVVLVVLIAWIWLRVDAKAHPFVTPSEPDANCAIADPDHNLDDDLRMELCAQLANSPSDKSEVLVEIVVMNPREHLGRDAVDTIARSWYVDADDRPRMVLLWDPLRDSLYGHTNASAGVDWKAISRSVESRKFYEYDRDPNAAAGMALVVEETVKLLGRG